jgi:hypothetical protein
LNQLLPFRKIIETRELFRVFDVLDIGESCFNNLLSLLKRLNWIAQPSLDTGRIPE